MHVIKNKNKKVVIICIFLVFGSIVTLVRYNQTASLEKYPPFKVDKNLKQADIVWIYNLTGGPGIYIDDSYTLSNWSNRVATYDWITGGGTQGNPYEIKNVLFDGEGRFMNLITIMNSVAHFRIEDCILYNSNYNGIYLENVENGIITNVNTSECTNGISQVNSNNSRIRGIIARNNSISGITVSGGFTNKIKNNTINDGSGIRLLGGTFNNEVLENTIAIGDNNDVGISISNSQYNNITFNMITDLQGSSGISLVGSDYNNVSENTVYHSGNGLNLVSSDNNFVSANSIVNGTFGVHISSSSTNTVSKNTISDSLSHGIYIENSDNHSIWENTVISSGADDIHLINTLAIKMALNDMYGSGLYFNIPESALADITIESSNLVNDKRIYLYINQSGLGLTDFINAGQIFLYDCNDTVISGMEFNYVSTGITLIRCFNSTISSNEALNNSRWTFSLVNCINNRILNNDGIGSSFILKNSNHSEVIGNTASYSMTDGISLENCHNNYIAGNTANYHREIGIRLYKANHSKLIGNTASYNMKDGFSLKICHNNYIAGNTASCNHEIGIRLYKTNHGLIHNNIANNNDETGISVIGEDAAWDIDHYVYINYYLLNISLTSNEANDNGNAGMVIVYVDNIIITGNTAKRNIYGIALSYFEPGIGIITENEVTGNKHGLSIERGLEVHVNNNTVISNGEFWGMSYLETQEGEGILIYICQKIEISDNIVNRNAQGLVLQYCSTGEVKYNHLSENGREASFLFFQNIPTGDHGILLIYSTNLNVSGNILNDNGIGVAYCSNIGLFSNKITGFGFILSGSHENIISGNLITNAVIAIDLGTSSYNNITFNIIIAQQCFRERGNCTSNVFEDNDCTEVLPTFYLREIISVIGIASVLGINIPLFLKKRKERK